MMNIRHVLTALPVSHDTSDGVTKD